MGCKKIRHYLSLSARRAWIEILIMFGKFVYFAGSLSARRAWIEISIIA